MYIVKNGFKISEKDSEGKKKNKFFKPGDSFPKHERAKELQAQGLIVPKEQIDLENLQAVEKALASKKAEVLALEEQAKALRSKQSSPAPKDGGKHSPGKE